MRQLTLYDGGSNKGRLSARLNYLLYCARSLGLTQVNPGLGLEFLTVSAGDCAAAICISTTPKEEVHIDFTYNGRRPKKIRRLVAVYGEDLSLWYEGSTFYGPPVDIAQLIDNLEVALPIPNPQVAYGYCDPEGNLTAIIFTSPVRTVNKCYRGLEVMTFVMKGHQLPQELRINSRDLNSAELASRLNQILEDGWLTPIGLNLSQTTVHLFPDLENPQAIEVVRHSAGNPIMLRGRYTHPIIMRGTYLRHDYVNGKPVVNAANISFENAPMASRDYFK